MEQENIEVSQPEQDLNVDASSNESVDSGYEGENYSTDSSESDSVSHETYETEYTPENEIEALKRELQETRDKQYEFERRIQEIYGSSRQSQQEEKEYTVDDVVRESLEKIYKEQMEVSARQAQDRLDYDFQNNVNSARSKIKDFDVVINRVNCITPSMFEMIKTAENAGVFAYHAAKNHEPELRRISALPNPQHQIREMVKLEQKIQNSLRPKTVSRAPAPMGETTGSAGLSRGFDVNGSSTADWAKFLRDNAKKR